MVGCKDLVVLLCAFVALMHKASASGCTEYSTPKKVVKFYPRKLVEEESGIATSRLNSGIIWVHNDNYSPKHIFGVSAINGRIVAQLSLEALPKINHHTDFEDISVAYCPFQNGTIEKEWCIWVGDTGSNVGTKEIIMYVIKEPKVTGYTMTMTMKVDVKDTFIFKITYDDSRRVPNIEAMTTKMDGTKFWCIQKTFSDNGNGPAGIWESPDLQESQGFPLETCVSNYTGVDDWKCSLSFPYAIHQHRSDPDRSATVFHIKMKKVNEIENPYPDCGKWVSENDPGFQIFDYTEEEKQKLPLCTQRELQPSRYSCKQEAKWGKCNEDWMIKNSFCEWTCKRCRAAELDIRSAKGLSVETKSSWQTLEESCSHTKANMRNIRNIAAADLHESGRRLLIATYGGIFEYELKEAFNMSKSSLIFKRQISSTNRDGSNVHNGDYWAGQEGVAYDEQGQGVWSVSEHHKGFYYLSCKD